MGEIGCLKDGNFQNLEASTIMQGGNLLKVAGYTNITATAADASADVAAGGDLTANGIHFLAVNSAANVATFRRIITLPAAGIGLNVGDYFTFVVVRGSADAVGFTITTSAADKIVGLVEVAHVTNSTVVSQANRTNTDAAARDENNIDYAGQVDVVGSNSIVLVDDANGAGTTGGKLTLTYAGKPDGVNAMYFATGRLVSDDVAGTSAGVFI